MATDDEDEEEEEDTEDAEEEEDTEEETEEVTKEEITGTSTGGSNLPILVSIIGTLIFIGLAVMSFMKGDWINGSVLTVVGIIVGFLAASSFGINSQWEEVVIFRLGKYRRSSKAGIYFLIPFFENGIKRDMRIRTLDIPTQEVITKDNVSIKLDAVIFMKVDDIKKSVINIQDFIYSVRQVSQTTLRDIAGQKTLDELLEKRDEYAGAVSKIIDKLVENWGVDIQNISIQNMELPQDMKKTLSIQAQAERESKAILIKAQAELNASKTLKQAADVMSNPNAMQLRILQSISEVSKDEANTIIMALPLETLQNIGIGGVGALASINSSAARRLKWYKKKSNESNDNLNK